MSKETRAAYSRHSCSVIGCQDQDKNLFVLPSGDSDLRNRWITFIFNGNVPVAPGGYLFVCGKHFSPDSFTNLGQYNAGLAKKLRLEKGVVPSIRDPTTAQLVVTAGSSSKIFPAVRHVACQTDLPERLSVGTQVYMKTYIRSKGTQARVASRDCGMCTLTFPLDSPLLFLQPTIVKRPSKRPRLSLTDKEEGPSQCKLSVLVHEPEDST